MEMYSDTARVFAKKKPLREMTEAELYDELRWINRMRLRARMFILAGVVILFAVLISHATQ